jgi:hypothetical protein
MTTNDATTKELDQLVRMFRLTPWLAMRDRTIALWSAAHSTDAAERIARKAGVGEDDARKLAPVIRDMVAALALALERMPIRETRPALIPAPTLDAYVERVHDVGRARGFFTPDERPPGTYEEHQLWAQRPQSGVSVRGWLDHELVEGDTAGDMLRADRALLDVVGAYLADGDRENVERYAQRVWATFNEAGPVTWFIIEGSPLVGDTTVDDDDAKRLVSLWRRWLDGAHATALVNAAATKLARDEEARREAERTETLRAERAGKHPAMPRLVTRTLQGNAKADDADETRIVTLDGRLTLATGPRIRLPDTRLEPIHALIAAHIARMAHRQWQQLDASPNELVFKAGREAMREHFGGLGSADDLLNKLYDLQGVSVEGFRLIDAVNLVHGEKVTTGRPVTMVRVVVGVPLAPLALMAKLKDQKVKLPASEKWYTPVLEPWAGGHMQRSERYRERHAVEIVLPSLLLDRRVEYATEGVKPRDLADELASLTGFRSKEAADLLDRLSKGDTQTGQTVLAPVLQPVEPRADRYRLGAAHADAHTMLMAAAGKTQRSQRGAVASREPKPRRNRKDKQ